MDQKIKIEHGWYLALEEEFSKPYFRDIKNFLVQEKERGRIIFPNGNQIFNAFDSTPFDEVKVVILGQDPYHGVGQAMGLSFSVPNGIKIPASLSNIYKELNRDLGCTYPTHGNLSNWAKQGVLLLNSILTVEKEKPASHQKIGWQNFTDRAIQTLSSNKRNLVFMLWGNFARSKKGLINLEKHLVLESVHPSPLARGKFIGNGHFSSCNEYLVKHHINQIKWNLD